MDALLSALEKINESFGGVEKVAEQATLATKEVGKNAESAGKAAEKGSKGFNLFGNSLLRIVKYRIIRSVIRSITDSFKEGLQNAYQFSKGISGDLAKAMDTLSVKSMTMKNQLGSAFGELITSVTPVLLRIIELARSAADALAQFFAALSGRSTYLKAVDATGDMSKNLSKGAGAAKEMRRQLMGFDEINRLDAPSDGGGGGGGVDTEAFTKMFEENPIPQWMQDLGERLREILPIIATIAGIIAGISILRHIGEVLKWGEAFDGLMVKLIGIALAIAGAVLLFDGFADALNNGVNWGNLIEMLAGTTVLVIGLKTAFGTTGAAIGLLVSGVLLCIAGLKSWIETGEASVPVLTAISAGVLAIGASIALLTGSWIPLVIAGVGALAVWVIGKWDEIKTTFGSVMVAIVNTAIDLVNGFITFFIQPLVDAVNFLGSIVGAGWNFNVPTLNHIDGFANGGFPEDGLFLSNHNELVGKFSNGKTAVANNEEIVEGIKRGVLEAMTAAMSGNSGTQNVNVYLDGKQITNAVTQNQRQMSRATGVAYG